MDIDPRVVRQLKADIEHQEDIIASTARILDVPFQSVGAFVTGRSKRPKSLDRMVDSENNRRADAFRRQQAAKQELQVLTNHLEAYQAGEVYANGQQRADAPSRQKRDQARATYGEWVKSLAVAGKRMALMVNPRNTVLIKRVNLKTITDDMGEKWEFSELVPLNEAGEAMTADELKCAYRQWKQGD